MEFLPPFLIFIIYTWIKRTRIQPHCDDARDTEILASTVTKLYSIAWTHIIIILFRGCQCNMENVNKNRWRLTYRAAYLHLVYLRWYKPYAFITFGFSDKFLSE